MNIFIVFGNQRKTEVAFALHTRIGLPGGVIVTRSNMDRTHHTGWCAQCWQTRRLTGNRCQVLAILLPASPDRLLLIDWWPWERSILTQ
jgi:hypothetical protein